MVEWFDDLKVGMRFKSAAVTVSKEDILRFAREYDPQPFHLDDEAAKKTILGGLAASGWHTAAIAMRLATECKPFGPHPLFGAGVDDLRWLKPVRPGDSIHLEGRWWNCCPRARSRKASPASNGPPITRRARRSTPSIRSRSCPAGRRERPRSFVPRSAEKQAVGYRLILNDVAPPFSAPSNMISTRILSPVSSRGSSISALASPAIALRSSVARGFATSCSPSHHQTV